MKACYFLKKAFRNDPVSTSALAAVFVVLAAEAFLCCHVISTNTHRSTNASIFMLACSIGSLLGMLASPYTTQEKAGFSSTAKLAIAFAAGLFTDAARTRIASSCLGKDNIFLVSIALAAAILTFMFAYILRAYIVPNLYDGKRR